jgi:hypothetical protein
MTVIHNILNERRTSQRYRCNGQLKYAQLAKGNFREAELVDYSEEGLCFKSNFELKPGNYIFIRVQTESVRTNRTDCDVKVRSVSVVEIKWCYEKHDGHNCFYLIGAKYPFSDWH